MPSFIIDRLFDPPYGTVTDTTMPRWRVGRVSAPNDFFTSPRRQQGAVLAPRIRPRTRLRG
jgi:hypothetical protein